MTDIDQLNAISFQIVAAAGNARSLYMEAVAAAGEGDDARSDALVAEAAESFGEGHHAHAELVRREASGDPVDMTLLLTHAEDQLMGAEQFGIMAEQLIALHRRVRALEAAVSPTGSIVAA